jgi:hypothetical protein
MKADCILAAGQVLGRQPSEADVRKLEQALGRAMRAEASRDPKAWQALPIDAQMRQGAERAAQDMIGEAGLKQQRQVLQVIKTAQIGQALASFPGNPFEALERLVATHFDGKGSQLSAEYRIRAIKARAVSTMVGTLTATQPKFFGLIEDKAGLYDLVRELHGQHTGNPDAKAGAAEFKQSAEVLRLRMNAGGGDIGHREDWGMPHHHSQLKVAKAGADQWIKDTLPELNRDIYVTEAGRQMNDSEMDTFLHTAWPTIASGGANKLEPGQFTGNGMRANRGNAAREIHFKDGDAYLRYQAKYGEHTPYEVLTGHIASLAQDVGLVETFGPNPDATFKLFHDQALKTMSVADPVNLGKHQKTAQSIINKYNIVAGHHLPVGSEAMAKFFDNVRNVLVFSRLGSAAITSLADEGTMRMAAHVNNLPEMQLVANELAAHNVFNKDEERFANRAGLGLNHLAASINRFGNDMLGSGWSSKLANATIRASGLNAMTEARRRAFGVTFMSALGHLAQSTDSLAALDKSDHRILLSKGITETDFAVWKTAELEQWGETNPHMLTPESIYQIPDSALAHMGDPRQLREEAATKLLGAVLEETDTAVVEPGAVDRAHMLSGLQRGTWKGELTRSFFLFKSFPLAMITKHWERAMSMPTLGGKVAYMSALTAATTAIGLVALQIQQLVSGKDPRSMLAPSTYIAGLMRGGALSIYGDFLFSDQTQGGQSPIATAAGPVAGLFEDVFKLTQGSLVKQAEGKKVDFGANLTKFVHSNLPGANLWYTKAATDHLVFQQLQEYMSPGYLRRMRDNAEKNYHQKFWWEPGENVPQRAPDMAAMTEPTPQ